MGATVVVGLEVEAALVKVGDVVGKVKGGSMARRTVVARVGSGSVRERPEPRSSAARAPEQGLQF
jgi:hypothetical protein